MGGSIPFINAIIARLGQPEINLAAYGGIAQPISILIETPIMLILGASTALTRDWPSYLRLRKFMMLLGATLTTIHFLVAFTPLYDLVVAKIIGAPPEIIEPGRLGLRLMLPWSWSIGFRRFYQGILIRYGHSNSIAIGTIIRLATLTIVLFIGYQIGTLPGILIAGIGQSLAVMSEAAYTALRVRPILRCQLRHEPPGDVLTWRGLARFYSPLVITSIITYTWQPIGTAGLSRMPQAIESLATWAVLSGLLFIVRSFGLSYNEVVVALVDRRGSLAGLRRFTLLLSLATTLLILLIAATPLSGVWFVGISALSAPLAALANEGLWLCLPIAGVAVFQSWYQGILIHSRRTTSIPLAVAIFLLVFVSLLAAGASTAVMPGIYVISIALTLANASQAAWLWLRSRDVLHGLERRDALDAAG